MLAERLSKAADAINALDREMSSVRNEIMDAQNSSQMQSNLVKDILINIENLYKLANKREDHEDPGRIPASVQNQGSAAAGALPQTA